MYCGRDFDPIDSGVEDSTFTLDFVNDLSAGETITGGSAVATLTVIKGTDPSPASRLSGAPAISGTKVSQTIDVRGAPAGAVYYQLRIVVATNMQPALCLWSHFWSRNPD